MKWIIKWKELKLNGRMLKTGLWIGAANKMCFLLGYKDGVCFKVLTEKKNKHPVKITCFYPNIKKNPCKLSINRERGAVKKY